VKRGGDKVERGSGSPLLEPDFLLPERKTRIDAVVAERTRTLTVVMEAFCDPQNVNAVLRTCEAFGVQTLHAVEGPLKPYDRHHLGEGSVPLGNLSFAQKVALVFGNENRGVSDEALALSDARYMIPMRGFSQSLNVSVAAAISLATAVERREAERGRHGDLSVAEAQALRERFYVLAVKQRARVAKAQQVEARRLRHAAHRGT
jgi:tRNA (guanosine-2'-O-)-methyltransferase